MEKLFTERAKDITNEIEEMKATRAETLEQMNFLNEELNTAQGEKMESKGTLEEIDKLIEESDEEPIKGIGQIRKQIKKDKQKAEELYRKLNGQMQSLDQTRLDLNRKIVAAESGLKYQQDNLDTLKRILTDPEMDEASKKEVSDSSSKEPEKPSEEPKPEGEPKPENES